MARRALVALGIGGAVASAAGWMVFAQPGAPANAPESPPPANAAPPVQPEQPQLPVVTPPTNNADEGGPEASTSTPGAAAKPPPEAKPAEPPKPVRSSAAILQALDKVSAETMRFAAPIGQRIRYKNLVFTVKACETSGLGDPAPRSSAYVVVESEPRATLGRVPAKEVFHGWMFADTPGLHPLQHPVYDAWVIACMAAPPAT
jgi:hypothetical protein